MIEVVPFFLGEHSRLLPGLAECLARTFGVPVEPDLSACPDGPFRLCLSHTPDNLAWAARHGIDLMLSGHVHGGQIRFPWIGPLVMPSRYGRWYDQGAFDEPPAILYDSRGLSGEEPVRYNCLPEATLLTLRRPPDS